MRLNMEGCVAIGLVDGVRHCGDHDFVAKADDPGYKKTLVQKTIEQTLCTHLSRSEYIYNVLRAVSTSNNSMIVPLVTALEYSEEPRHDSSMTGFSNRVNWAVGCHLLRSHRRRRRCGVPHDLNVTMYGESSFSNSAEIVGHVSLSPVSAQESVI